VDMSKALPKSKDDLIIELQEINSALVEKLSGLNKRMMKRNDAQALKWRNSAFYYKGKYKDMMKIIKLARVERGISS